MPDEKPGVDTQVPETQNNNTSSLAESPTQNAADFELKGLPLALVMTGLGLAIFLMSLDGSIIATAIPRITSQFNSISDVGWYGSVYAFSMCALQPMVGKLFASFSMKIIFLGALFVFEFGSLLCAVAVNSAMLIVGRAIAGAGAAGCTTGSFAIVALSMPLEKRPVYTGGLQSLYGIATIIGPIVGGALTQHATWRWCFWINLPIGTITILTMVFFFNPPANTANKSTSVLRRLVQLDVIGALLFIPTTIMALLALQWGGTKFPWKSATVIGLFLGSVGLGLIFGLWQVRKGDDAMVPPRLITMRTLFFGCSSDFFAMGAVLISIYYLPEWFQVIKGATPTKSGLMYLPLALSDVLAATVTGASLKFIGYPNPYALLGTALMSIATGLISTFTTTTNHQHWIPYQILQGLGAGMTLSMPYVAVQTVLKPEDIPVGISLLQCFQFLGMSVFLAVAESLFSNNLESQLRRFGFSQNDIQRIINAGSGQVRTAVPATQLPDVVNAYNSAITKPFYLAASVAVVAFLLSTGMEWRSIKPAKAKHIDEDVEAKALESNLSCSTASR